MMIAEFRAAESMIENAAMGPLRMLAGVNRMIRNTALSALQVAQQQLDELAEQLGLIAVEDSLAWMKTCMMILRNCSKSIAENPLIQSAIDVDMAAIDDVTDPSQLPGLSRKYLESRLKDAALRTLDKGLATMGMGSKFGQTQAKYLKNLEAAGILDGLDLMQDIITCLEMVCSQAGDYAARRSQWLTMLHIDDAYQLSGDLWADAGDPSKSEAINQTAAAIGQIESMIDAWSLV